MTQVRIRKETAGSGTLEFIGSFEDFEIKCPNILKTIELEDIYIAEISEDIDPNEFASHLIIQGYESSEYEPELADKYHEFDFDDDGSMPGSIRRNALVVQNQNKFQIIGIKNDKEVHSFAITPQYMCSYLWDLFGNDYLLAYSQWYSEGPGPVSWEGQNAVFQIGDTLIFAASGDMEEDLSVRKITSPESIIESLYDWIVDHGELAYFILTNVPIKWSNDKLKLEIENNLKQVGENNILDLRINDIQIKQLIDLVRRKQNPDSQLVEILESKDHPQIQKIAKFISDVASAGGAKGKLSSWGNFLENL